MSDSGRAIKRQGNPDPPGLFAERFLAYFRLTRLHRPIGILLLLWPTLCALWLAAAGPPDTTVLLIFVMGTVFMRSAGCCVNDYFDRHIDGGVKRTRDRPLVAGEIPPRHALYLGMLLSLISFAMVLALNPLTIALAVVGAGLTLIYPLLKRVTHLPQAGLGLAFSWGIPMAWAAVAGGVPPVTWLLVIANIFWTIAYDTIYAMVDRDDDLRLGVRSTAILFGEDDLAALAVLYASMVATLFIVGMRIKLGTYYYLGLAAATILAAGFLWRVRKRDRHSCFQTFVANHWMGAVLFAGIVLDLA